MVLIDGQQKGQQIRLLGETLPSPNSGAGAFDMLQMKANS
jgi:hypothetical protein